MNSKRWLLVSYLLVLMVFSFSALLPTAKFHGPTTSDAGYFFGLTEEIVSNNGMVEKYSLSAPPVGESVGVSSQGQPLIATMVYKGLHSIFPGITPEDVTRYLPPIFFIFMIIPVFLIGRELAGDLCGCATAFFLAVMFYAPGTTSPLYWSKVGAFDRDVLVVLLSAWVIYATIRLFKAPRESATQSAIIAGLTYGMFALVWDGYLYLLPIITIALVLVVLNESFVHRGSGWGWRAIWRSICANASLIQGIAVMVGITGLMVWILGGIIFGLALATVAGALVALIVIGRAYGIKGMLVVAAGAAVGFVLIGQYLVDFVTWGLEFVGLKTPTIAYPIYATEAQPVKDWGSSVSGFYGAGPSYVLTQIVFLLLLLALVKIFWTRKRGELILLPWFLVLFLLGGSQTRFLRMWWPFLATLAGLGIVALFRVVRWLSEEPTVSASFGWLSSFREPLVLAFCAAVFVTPFIQNAQANVEHTGPPMGGELHEAIFDASEWLYSNTPENSIVAIQWSYGHLLTGASRRPSVVDGTETAVFEGEENKSALQPPDIIWRLYDIDEARQLWGEDYIRRIYRIDPYTKGVKLAAIVGGRRVDIQNLPLMGENEFAKIIRTYRDNYDCKIDYIIFNASEYYSAVDYYNITQPRNMLLEAERIDTQLESEPSFDGQNYVFNFGENRESVVLDTQTRGNVYLRTDNENLHLDGYGALVVDETGIITAYGGFNPPPSTVDISETLLVFVDTNDDLVGAWLIEAVSAEITTRPIPMGVRVFTGNIGGIDYLQIAYTSSNGRVKVSKINHVPSLISPAEDARTNDNTPAFQWSGAVGAVKYELWVDNDTDFSSPEILENFPNITSTVALAEGTYSWRVRAFKADNTELGWSPTLTFVIDVTPPTAAVLHVLENGATTSDNAPTFEWMLGAGATKHRLLVDNDADFSTPEVDVALDVPENTHTSSELAVRSYWWKVIAVDDANNENESSVWTFTVQA